MARKYVIAFLSSEYGQVLVIHKDRPAWQAGRINLPGGKMEPEDGGDPIRAAGRELLEETGYVCDPSGCTTLGTIARGHDALTHVVAIGRAPRRIPVDRSRETEEYEWIAWRQLRDDPRLIPSLRVAIPLAMAGIGGWRITDEISSAGEASHTITFEAPVCCPPPLPTP